MALLRKSFVYVGLGSPLEGPAALEAIANGAIFLNPKLVLSQKFADERQTNRKMTSQNPYAEQIGKLWFENLRFDCCSRIYKN